MLKLNFVDLCKKLGIKFTAAQAEVVRALFVRQERFVTLIAGRRFGKTNLAAITVLFYLLLGQKKIWVVAPTYDLAGRTWDKLEEWIGRFPKIKMYKSPQLMIENTLTGSKCWLKSCENEKSLLGEGLDLLVLDEAAEMDKMIWQKRLRPCLSDRNREGRLLIITTPLRKNWVYDMYLRGQKENNYCSFKFKSTQGWCPKSEYEEAKKDMLADEFREQYDAEFLDDNSKVFRNYMNSVKGEELATEGLHIRTEYVPGHQYRIGMDLAQLVDFTVIYVLDLMTHQIVAWDHFNQLEYLYQRQRLRTLYDKYGGYDGIEQIIVDETGVGSSIVQDMQREGLPVTGFKISGHRKKSDLIRNLAIILEKGLINIPREKGLITELEVYESQFNPNSGITRYNAPPGFHDDRVIALALTVYDLYDKLLVEKVKKIPVTLDEKFHAEVKKAFNRHKQRTEPEELFLY